MPDWLLWLLPVLLAGPLAGTWLLWTGRAVRPLEVTDSVQEYARFRDALARQATSERARRSGSRPPG